MKLTHAAAIAVITVAVALPAGAAERHPAALDQAVSDALDRAVQHLFSVQNNDGSWGNNQRYPAGPTALVVHALLETGVSPQDARIGKALQYLASVDSHKTYSLGLRANVWEQANRKTNRKYLQALKADVERLYLSTRDGSYSYNS